MAIQRLDSNPNEILINPSGIGSFRLSISDVLINRIENNSKPGTPGKNGTNGKDGKDGQDGKDGKDGSCGFISQLCPDNGKYYNFIPRILDDPNNPNTEWVETATPTLVSIAIQCPDNLKFYVPTPRILDDPNNPNTEWVEACP